MASEKVTLIYEIEREAKDLLQGVCMSPSFVSLQHSAPHYQVAIVQKVGFSC